MNCIYFIRISKTRRSENGLKLAEAINFAVLLYAPFADLRNMCNTIEVDFYTFSTRQNTNAKPLTACWGYVYRFQFYAHLIFFRKKVEERSKAGK